MFWSTVGRARKDLDDLRRVVATHEELRNLAISSEHSGVLRRIIEENGFPPPAFPTRSVWVLYDHCAAITRLYAIFEDFVDNIIKEYLEALPNIYPAYLDLPQPVLTQHRIGVAQILSKLGDKGLYKHLTEQVTLQGISEGNLGRNYSLLPEAFLTDAQNYRAEQINIVFSYLAISSIWAGVEKHVEILEYMRWRDPNEAPRTILSKLVGDRNLAAHSVVSDVLSTVELLSLVRFIEVVVIAISEIARKNCVTLECSRGKRLVMFNVIHTYSNRIVGVKFIDGQINVDSPLLVLEGNRAFKARVLSIRNLTIPLESADAHSYPELGLQLDVQVRKGARLVAFHRTDNNLPENNIDQSPRPTLF